MKTGVMPVGHLSESQMRSVLLAATAPPPLRRGRPWRFQCTPDAVELYADSLSTGTDSDQRERMLDCGAALLNLRLAIKAQSSHADTRLFPTADRPDLLAVVRPNGYETIAPVDRELVAAIADRQSNRRPFTAAVIPDAVQRQLRRAAEVERAWLATITDDQVPQLRDIMHRTELPPATPGPGGGSDLDIEPGRLVVVIGSLHDTALGRLQAGQALQRVLLTAAAAGLSAALSSQVMAVPAARRELRQLLGGGLWPQVMLRLGHGTAVASPTQTQLEDVVISDAHPFGR
ncbi:hypothetical protein [Amycolatopsis sp. MtRt-6]|uniref:hypothetical protein n=1 Tax=Amycolatopsis sp. MtRt-6 TaxID=2792782 RepID=UPI001F5D377E|nr:hypothetical protein [Amycolatopsis sp. MtRt-6]